MKEEDIKILIKTKKKKNDIKLQKRQKKKLSEKSKKKLLLTGTLWCSLPQPFLNIW